jgi:D-alanyl-D-alanine carboxypeptidase
MAEIARAVMAEPALAQIVGTRRRIFDGPPMYLFVTSNPLLGFYAGLDGVKTGFTDDAGPSLAASALREGRRLVSVVLNSSGIAQETTVLLDWGYGLRPQSVEVPKPGFALVQQDPSSDSGSRAVSLAGWEWPLLRGYSTRTSTTVWLGERKLVEWQR